MVAAVSVSERDLRALLGIVRGDRDELPEYGLPLSLLSGLMAQVGCDVLTFSGQDTRRQEFSFGQDIPDGASDDGEDGENGGRRFWDAYRDCAHCAYPDLGDLRSITKTSDFYSARQWRNTRMYADGLPGFEHMLMLSLPAGPGPATKPGPGPDVRLVFLRGPGPDFSERDRLLLELLRPHLYQTWADVQRQRCGTPALTPRQRELLGLVAAGHTNGQIARKLNISAGTVRIHLQNAYGLLQVSSRTAAVTRAFADRAAP
ncbi:MAG TPA: helix-turn-helix transcriptional regulator [Streptosporangiaceae bacterium]|nr:helix-turn-helix transcriptional regulator [Streptosporangiaceae bacterium]